MNNRKIYLLLTRFPDKGSMVIKRMKGIQYPHTSIGLDEDMNTFYSFLTKGFIVESVTRYVKPHREPFPCQLYELEVSQEVYDRVKEIVEYFVEFSGLFKYTKVGVILSLLRIPYVRSHFSYFCSEFVADVLHHSGAAKLNKKRNMYFADDLKQLPGMKLKHQGNLKTLINQLGLTKQGCILPV